MGGGSLSATTARNYKPLSSCEEGVVVVRCSGGGECLAFNKRQHCFFER